VSLCSFVGHVRQLLTYLGVDTIARVLGGTNVYDGEERSREREEESREGDNGMVVKEPSH